MDKNNYKGSSPAKDQLLLVGNLVCTTDHLLESAMSNPEDAEQYLAVIKTVDETRTEFMKLFTKDIPEELWCVYKHLAAARVLAQELAKTGYDEMLMVEINSILVELLGSEYEACATCRADKGEESNGN